MSAAAFRARSFCCVWPCSPAVPGPVAKAAEVGASAEEKRVPTGIPASCGSSPKSGISTPVHPEEAPPSRALPGPVTKAAEEAIGGSMISTSSHSMVLSNYHSLNMLVLNSTPGYPGVVG